MWLYLLSRKQFEEAQESTHYTTMASQYRCSGFPLSIQWGAVQQISEFSKSSDKKAHTIMRTWVVPSTRMDQHRSTFSDSEVERSPTNVAIVKVFKMQTLCFDHDQKLSLAPLHVCLNPEYKWRLEN